MDFANGGPVGRHWENVFSVIKPGLIMVVMQKGKTWKFRTRTSSSSPNQQLENLRTYFNLQKFEGNIYILQRAIGNLIPLPITLK